MKHSALPLSITPLNSEQEIPYHLLELADPSRKQINAYLEKGSCYLATKGDETVGAMVLLPIDPHTLEIKNLAVKPDHQGQGLGKSLLKESEKIARESGCLRLTIATGNSSIGQLALYQKVGFEIIGIDRNFFTRNYDEPIYENGIQCKHQMLLEKQL